MRTYVTAQGAMWERIAHSQLGSSSYTDKLMSLNSQYIDTFVFEAGISLKLPDVQETVSTKAPPWKVVSG